MLEFWREIGARFAYIMSGPGPAPSLPLQARARASPRRVAARERGKEPRVSVPRPRGSHIIRGQGPADKQATSQGDPGVSARETQGFGACQMTAFFGDSTQNKDAPVDPGLGFFQLSSQVLQASEEFWEELAQPRSDV